MIVSRARGRSTSRIVRDKEEADFYLSRGANLVKKVGDRYYFLVEETRNMRLEWRILYGHK